ncbi:MAG: class I SAM-dependent methyltransferase [Halioglobus sp.]|nr:class I SAM-dependent methyltransferase [Halioglobus sp.]
MSASKLLSQYMQQLARACRTAPALDLACGTGRNGLHLLASDIPVVFADRDNEKLEHIRQHLDTLSPDRQRQLASLWQVDLEIPGSHPLDGRTFGAIMVFRYLHRPLLDAIKNAVIPGGLVVYETFTEEQAAIGRPRNPDFLLRHAELKDCFSEWNILHYFEGIEHDPDSGQRRAIAQVVAEKPFV